MSCFRLAEGQFALHNVTDPVACYYHVLASLSQDAVQPMHHMLHDETGPASYDNLRTSLLSSFGLSNYQKMEKMMRLPSLGDRKPSVMLADMLEYCPTGESTTTIFAYLFLQGHPREIQVLLSEDDPADMRAIADKADRLITMHVPQVHDACAAVAGKNDQDGDLAVASIGARRKKKFLVSKGPQQQQQQQLQQQGDLWNSDSELSQEINAQNGSCHCCLQKLGSKKLALKLDGFLSKSPRGDWLSNCSL